MKLNDLLTSTDHIYHSVVVLTRSDSIFDNSEHILCSDKDGNYYFEFNSTQIFNTDDLPPEIDAIEFQITFNLPCK